MDLLNFVYLLSNHREILQEQIDSVVFGHHFGHQTHQNQDILAVAIDCWRFSCQEAALEIRIVPVPSLITSLQIVLVLSQELS